MTTVFRNAFLALALVTAACAEQEELPGPVVYIKTGGAFNLKTDLQTENWDGHQLEFVQLGAEQWRWIGFDVRPLGEKIDPDLTHIDTTILDYFPAPEMKTSYIIIEVYRDPSLIKYNGLSNSSHRLIFINGELRNWMLARIVAHELGHQLLRVGHLPDDKKGVMNSVDSGFLRPTKDDLELACEIAKRCQTYNQ
jgi:hypothetical protein